MVCGHCRGTLLGLFSSFRNEGLRAGPMGAELFNPHHDRQLSNRTGEVLLGLPVSVYMILTVRYDTLSTTRPSFQIPSLGTAASGKTNGTTLLTRTRRSWTPSDPGTKRWSRKRRILHHAVKISLTRPSRFRGQSPSTTGSSRPLWLLCPILSLFCAMMSQPRSVVTVASSQPGCVRAWRRGHG